MMMSMEKSKSKTATKLKNPKVVLIEALGRHRDAFPGRDHQLQQDLGPPGSRHRHQQALQDETRWRSPTTSSAETESMTSGRIEIKVGYFGVSHESLSPPEHLGLRLSNSRKVSSGMSVKSKGAIFGRRKALPRKFALLLCFGCFCAGMFFTNRTWVMPEATNIPRTSETRNKQLNFKSEDCNMKVVLKHTFNDSLREVPNTQHVIQMLNKTVSDLEMKLAAARAVRESVNNGDTVSSDLKTVESTSERKYLMVIGINTAFSSRKRRDSVRMTWMPQGEKRKRLEEEKGIVIRFVIGHSSTSGGILDKAIEAEERMHGDFLRLDHVEGYMELSAKTKTYFSTAVALWDAEFYVKVDDDVHVNLATLGTTLARHRIKPRVYIGCMKSGPVLARKGVRYHEPEYWKFGTEGNKYFRHATGQLYAISKELATYISINQNVLHKYANEDVSIGSWFIGLDVEYVDDRRLCCGTPPDCEWKAQAGNICVASFDWRCSGICNSVERIAEVHHRCSEDENALWSASF